MAAVSFVKGVVRYDNAFKALEMVQDDVGERISGSSRIVLKPDLLHINGCNELELSNIDAVKAVLDFAEQFTNKRITIAEGSFVEEDVFHRHNFHELLDDYSVRFLDLTHDDAVPIKIGSSVISVSKALLESDFRISVAVLKRDKRLRLLGAVPNIVLGSIVEGKDLFYKSPKVSSSAAEIFKLVKPHLSLIDGFDAVKAERKVKFSSAIGSSDAAAADRVAAGVLKVKPGYLAHCGSRTVKILG